MKQNGILGFSIPHLVPGLFMFSRYANQAYDVIYKQSLNQIHKIRNISENNKQKVLKLCTCTPMRIVHTTVYSKLFARTAAKNQNLSTKNLQIFYFCLLLKIACLNPQKYNIDVFTNLRICAHWKTLFDKEEINGFCFTNERVLTASALNILYTVVCTILIGVHIQIFNTICYLSK